MVTLPSDEENYDVFFTQVQNVDTQVIIEVLCVKKAPKYFRIQLRVEMFRVVDTWKDLGDDYDGESPQPILDNIKVLKVEMKRVDRDRLYLGGKLCEHDKLSDKRYRQPRGF